MSEAEAAPGTKGRATILVVDDEVLVRTVVSEYLRDCGFSAVEAASGDEALAVLSSELDVDVVFSDVEMPGSINGFGLAQWVRRHRPELKVILTSGNASKASDARDLCAQGGFVAKPYAIEDLASRIARLLASHPR